MTGDGGTGLLSLPEFRRVLPILSVSVQEMLVRPSFRRWLDLNGCDSEDLHAAAATVAFELILKKALLKLLQDSYKVESFPETNTFLHREVFKPSPIDEEFENASQIDDSIEGLADRVLKMNSAERGSLYYELVSQERRRLFGQFWTPPEVADFMVRTALSSKTDSLLDPGCGPGTFMIAALAYLEELGSEDAIEQVYGVEISSVLYYLAMINVMELSKGRIPHIWLQDFLMMRSSRGSFQSKIQESPEVGITLNQFDAVVCNPPYTRHHLLPLVYKTQVMAELESVFGVRLSRISSLFVYFFLHALGFLKENGRSVFITPTVVFDSLHSSVVKQVVLQRLSLQTIVNFSKLEVFPGTDTGVCVTILTKRPGWDGRFDLITPSSWPGTSTLLDWLGGSGLEDASVDVRRVDVNKVRPSHKWTTQNVGHEYPANGYFTKLSRVAKVVRGVATGANSFFTLTEQQVEDWQIDRDCLKPVLMRNRDVPGYVLNKQDFNGMLRAGKPCWLLYCNEVPQVLSLRKVWKYIRHGEGLGIPNRSLVKTRKYWYFTEKRNPPPIIYTYLSRSKSRFVLNEAKVQALNTFLLIYPVAEIVLDPTALRAFLAILNSPSARTEIRRIGRSYGSDTVKLEPRELDDLVILNPSKVTVEDRERLAKLFLELSEAPGEQKILQAIEAVISGYISKKGDWTASTGDRSTP